MGPGTRLAWRRLGLVFTPDAALGWVADSALNPTAMLLDHATLRVFVGIRDEDGVSRVGWVDLDARDPTRVLASATRPALDVGAAGAFDDNGVVPAAVVAHPDGLWLYYAGYQLVRRVRFLIFTGLARSADGGRSFHRILTTPVTDRVPGESHFRQLHAVLPDAAGWRGFYAGGESWDEGERPTPRYDIRSTTSPDGIAFAREGQVCVPAGPNDLRVARPSVLPARSGGFHMLLSYQSVGSPYRTGYAWSQDGLAWTRDDAAAGLEPAGAGAGWDGLMAAFGSVVEAHGQTYLLYNGDDMGREGFGVAVLESASS